MRISRSLIVLLSATAACGDAARDPVHLTAPSAHHARATTSGHFAFLPPLAPETRPSGQADATLAPVVEICMITAGNCELPFAAVLTTAGIGDDGVRFVAGSGVYMANWHPVRTDGEQAYRIRVRVGTLILGTIDVRPTARTIPVRFRIERGAIGQLAITVRNFAASPVVEQQTEIYLIREDGSGLTRLLAGKRPSWSPDGQRIAFVRNADPDPYAPDPGGNIGVISLSDASSVVVLPGTEHATFNASAPLVWSPDGMRIAFEADWQIKVVAANGSSPAVTITPQYSNTPVWSNDGSRILFAAGYAGVTQMFTVLPNGDGLTQVTDGPTDDKWPAPGSYDGQHFLFAAGPLNPPFPDENQVQYINSYDMSTGTTTKLIDGILSPYAANFTMYPQLTPDKTRLYFYSYGQDAAGPPGIWTVRIDGTQLTRIINGAAVESSPLFTGGAQLQSIASWRP